MARAEKANAATAIADNFNPMDIASTNNGSTPIAAVPANHNQPPEVILFTEIDDLFEEAKNFADGEPITSEAMHDAMTELRDRLHKAGAAAELLRKEAVKPHDEAKASIQAAYNPYVKDKTGKVALGKAAIDELTGAWRIVKQREAEAEATRIAEEAAKATAAAQAAIQSTAGNLAARVEAEEQLAHAASLQKAAKRADKAATTGTGLVTRWVAVMVDEEKAMDWLWARAKDEVLAVAQRNADELVRSGGRSVPGFRVEEDRRAR